MTHYVPPRGARGYYASPYDARKRAEVRQDYEAPDRTLGEIVTQHGVSASTIHRWMRIEGWRMRNPHRIDPNDLVGRIFELLDGQMADLEVATMNGATEVAMLAKLVTTLDRVLKLKERVAAERPKSSKRAELLRAKIAERIGELNRA